MKSTCDKKCNLCRDNKDCKYCLICTPPKDD